MLNLILDIFILIFKSIFFLLLFLITLVLLLLGLGMFFLHKEDTKKAKLKKIYTESNDTCIVKLIAVGSEKIQIIKELKKFIDMDLSIATVKVESELPAVLSYDMPRELAEALKVNLEKLNTVIEIH